MQQKGTYLGRCFFSGRENSMDNFKVIYKILKMLEKALDYEELDVNAFSCENLGLSENRRDSILVMLQESGYIKGVVIVECLSGRAVNFSGMQITLKGLEYLNENSLMRKAANIAKGIKDIVPGL